MTAPSNSKYAVAGEPIADFIRRGSGTVSCWVTATKENGFALQRHIKASASRAGLSVRSRTMVAIEETDAKNVPGVRYIVTVTLIDKE